MNNENLKDISKRPDFKEITAKGGRANKGKKTLKTVLRELLATKDPKGEWANPIAIKLIKEAFDEGNYKAVVEIIDRIEGKSKEIKAVEVSGEIAHTVTKIDLDERVQRPETTC